MKKRYVALTVLVIAALVTSLLVIQHAQSNSTFRITRFTVVSGGQGYTTPHVTIVGGGGSGATAVARVSQGVILSVTLLTNGVGYTSVPTVTLRDPSPRARGAVVLAITDEMGILVNPPSFDLSTVVRNETRLLFANVSNIGNLAESLSLRVDNLPAYLTVTWNCTGTTLAPGASVIAQLNVTCAINAPLEPFNSNLVITGTELP
jgi:hypothetical protein